MVYRNLQAMCASAAMALPKKYTFRMVVDCRAANKQVEEVPAPIVNLERVAEKFAGAQALCTLDLLQG